MAITGSRLIFFARPPTKLFIFRAFRGLAFRRSKFWCNVVACDIIGWERTRRVTSSCMSCGSQNIAKRY